MYTCKCSFWGFRPQMLFIYRHLQTGNKVKKSSKLDSLITLACCKYLIMLCGIACNKLLKSLNLNLHKFLYAKHSVSQDMLGVCTEQQR